MEKTKKITFKQFLLTYDFRYYNENGLGDSEQEDTTIVRINYPTDDQEEDRHWFEFGMYDYEPNCYKKQHFEEIFSNNILNMYVSYFKHNDRLNILEVYLTKIKEEK